jgi:hypothetical protein
LLISLAVGGGALSAAVAPALAEPPAVDGAVASSQLDEDDVMHPASIPERRFEASLGVTFLGSLPEWQWHTKPGFELDLGWVPPGAQWFRPAAYYSFTWGEDAYGGGVESQFGLKLRLNFVHGDYYAVYLFAKGGPSLPHQTEPDVLLRPGGGFGVVLLRGLSVELGADAVIPLGSRSFPAEADAREGKWHPHLGAISALQADFCGLLQWGACKRAPKRPSTVDRTCLLYAKASQVCEAAHSERARVCEAVDKAADAEAHPVWDRGTGADAFLAALVAEAISQGVSQPVMDRVRALRQFNLDNRHVPSNERKRRVRAAELDGILRENVVYAPSPAELRRMVGCSGEPAGAAVCPKVDCVLVPR